MSSRTQNLRDNSPGSSQENNGAVVQHMHQTSKTSTSTSITTTKLKSGQQVRNFIVLTPYPVEPGHNLICIVRINESDWRTEMEANATYIAEGDNAGIIINKPASIMDYNKTQAAQKERQQPYSSKVAFKVSLINSETNKKTLEHRTLRFWLNHPIVSNNNDSLDDDYRATRTFANIKQESSQLAQAYFCQLLGAKPDDDFPKNYTSFLMKLMQLLKLNQFQRIIKMEVELRQLAYEESTDKPASPLSSIDGGSQSGDSGGRGSPLTSQKVLDIIESSYPNPISIKEICSTTQTEEPVVRQFVSELTNKEKINSTDNGQHFTRTLKQIDTKVNLVKQMPKVMKSQQPVIAIITAQYCEKLAVDSMISDKETFVRYRVATGQESASGELSSANYVYTLGNIGDHRVVSTKLTSIGHSRGALIAAGNATTRLLGTFPEIEYVFLVGCGGGVSNYSDFDLNVRLGDVVVSHLPTMDCDRLSGDGDPNSSAYQFNGNKSPSDYVYVHCRPKLQPQDAAANQRGAKQEVNIPVSYSIHKNLKKAAGLNGGDIGERNQINNNNNNSINDSTSSEADHNQSSAAISNKLIDYKECHFRLWRPANLDLQELTQRLWYQGLENPKHRIWEYYIDEGIKLLKQQDIDASRPKPGTDILKTSIGLNGTMEVDHPVAGENEIDLRRNGRPMCHFGPIGSGKPALANKALREQMISEFGIRAFDSEFDPVVESIYGNCKESYILIRGISDYKDGRKDKGWQQHSALVAAAFMKSVIVNLKPLN